MGALTDSRKRFFVDLYSSLSPVTPPPSFPFAGANSELFTSAPASKKPKVFPPETSGSQQGATPPPRAEKREEGPVRHEGPSRFPPAVPLRRQVIGPQRILKVFGLGTPESKSRSFERQSSVSAAETTTDFQFTQNKRARLSPVDARREIDHGEGKYGFLAGDVAEELNLEEYKRLVKTFQEETVPFTPPAAETAPISEVTELEVDSAPATRKDGQGSSLKALAKRVEEARKMVEIPVSPDNNWSKRSPLYKDLLEESARKHDQRLSDLSFEVKLAEERLSGIRLAVGKKHRDGKKQLKDDLAGPFAPLSEEENDEVDTALVEPMKISEGRRVLVVHEPSNIEITREVMQCLRHGAWLNDEVINLYLELLKEREKREPKKYLKCHFFNTFFYKKLFSGRGVYDFKAVRRWTTHRKLGYAITECDQIFIPIHKEIHWCLSIIDLKNKRFVYLDSLGGWDQEVLSNLGRYLMDEAKDKNNQIIDVESWKHEQVDDMPLQKNGWDCGMFMLKYVDFYSRGLDPLFGQEDMDYFRRRTVKEILRLRAE